MPNTTSKLFPNPVWFLDKTVQFFGFFSSRSITNLSFHANQFNEFIAGKNDDRVL